jgi:hypothetical protein
VSENTEQTNGVSLWRLGLVGAGVLCAGLAVAWMDTRPGWDDTGITVGLVVLIAASGALGGLWVWLSAALAVVPILALELPTGTGVLLAVPVAMCGAIVGSLVRRLAIRHRHPMDSR